MTLATRSAAKPKPRSGALYSVHPGLAYAQAVVAGMKSKTGRSIDEWVTLVKKHGPKTEPEQRHWLKKEHNLGSNYAGWIAGRVHGKGEEDTDPDKYLAAAERYVEQMFAGKRAALRPMYDQLLKLALSLGGDVKACPCQTMVPLFRKHVFCQIKPATNTRIDLGCCLRGIKPTKRLLDTGGEAKGDRITHRIAITSPEEIDDEVRRWMKRAYDFAKPEDRERRLESCHMKRKICLVVVVSIGLLGAYVVRAQDSAADQQAMMKAMQPGPQHKQLAKLAGEYTTQSKLKQLGVDDGQGGTATEESAGTAKLTMTMDGRFLQEEDAGRMMNAPFKGTKVTGYNNASGQYEAVWYWTMGTGFMTMTGKSDDGGKTIVCQASFTGMNGKPAKCTITTTFVDDDHFTVEIKEERAEMTTTYARKK